MKGIAFALIIAGCLLIGDTGTSLLWSAGLIGTGGLLTWWTT